MEKTKALRMERLVNKDERYFFFGYYDLQAFSQDGKLHLSHAVDFYQRMPKKTDYATIGIIDVERREFSPLAQTLAWNFQQGSMLQWNPTFPDREIIFNTYMGGGYRSVVMDIHTGQCKVFELPVANVDLAGHYALSISFSRLYGYRPGYGYLQCPDPFAKLRHPPKDGVFLLDLRSGKSRLILSLETIWQAAQSQYSLEDAKLVINHVTFNPAGNRFVLLARTNQGAKKRRVTVALTADIEGKNLRFLKNNGFASHYSWRDNEHLLIYCRHDAGKQLYLWNEDSSAKVRPVNPKFFIADGHCSYSPNKEFILYDDSRPVNNQRGLYLYRIKTRTGRKLGSYFADPRLYQDGPDLRCDLHPRWNASGTAISFDSVHEGFRSVYWMDLSELL